MPIIDLKKLKEHRDIKLSTIVNILFVILIFTAAVNYFGSNLERMAGVILIIGGMLYLEYLLYKTYHPSILKQPTRLLMVKIILI